MAQQKVQSIDPAQSRFGFEIKTRFGMKIEGFFPRFRGDVVTLADGRQQVRFRLDATQVEIPGKDRYTSWMRGEDFFDVAQYPVVEFESLPYVDEVVKQGGDIVGNLTIRGITHLETLHVGPAECTRPGYDCDVISRGTVLRGRYGMNAWQMALGDRVTFILRGRLQEARRP
nr:YceI family protein [Xanthomonas euvesicatoria]